jgi:hypothetical protein
MLMLLLMLLMPITITPLLNQAKSILREGCPPPPGLIVGCTNPFFLKLANAWPHL